MKTETTTNSGKIKFSELGVGNVTTLFTLKQNTNELYIKVAANGVEDNLYVNLQTGIAYSATQDFDVYAVDGATVSMKGVEE